MTRKDGKGPKEYGEFTARDLLDSKEPVAHSQPIATEMIYADRLAEAESAFEKLSSRKRLGLAAGDAVDQELAELEDAVEVAQAEYDAHAVLFTFQALGRKELDELVKVHKPTKVQEAEFARLAKLGQVQKGEMPYNTETLPPALIAACCLSPAFTLEEAQELWDSPRWSDAELAVIQNACWAVNKMIK